MRPQVVMKFGGTSVGTADAIQRVAGHVLAERRPRLVVVSAVGGVTNALIAAAEGAAAGGDIAPLLLRITALHEEIAGGLGLPADLLGDLHGQLARLLQGISLLRELTPRIRDEVLSTGERAAARLGAGALAAGGADVRPHDSGALGLRTDARHGAAEPLPDCPEAIRRAVEGLPAGQIPVVTGFIGCTTGEAITTLGRGGSDFSAAIFGAAVRAREIQIWTDVPGILRADPRVVQGAAVIPSLHFEEAAELAFFGAKVLHPRTIEPARRQRIPVRVLSSLGPPGGEGAAGGTLITDQPAPEPVRALAMRQDVESLQIHSLRMLAAQGFLARVFAILARHGVSVDVVATSEVSVSITFDHAEGDLPAAVAEIATFAEVEQFPRRSLICLVGRGLREDPALRARAFALLAQEGIMAHVISQGASRINLTMVLDTDQAPRALRSLHDHLFG